VKQAKARIFEGLTQFPGKIVSLFEPHTEIICKGKASKPTEFGKMVQIQEAENQIITHTMCLTGGERPRTVPGSRGGARADPGQSANLATADAGYYSQAQERAAKRRV